MAEIVGFPMMENLPEHMRGAMERYIMDGIEPGSFLAAVLTNDLKKAVLAADHINIGRLPDYVSFLYSHAPAGCWGSEALCMRWIEAGGLNGMMEKHDD